MKIPNITEVPSESLVELVVKSVYEGDGNGTTSTKVLGVSNLTIGVPVGGWTCNAAIVTKGEEDTLECVYDGERYRDTVTDSLTQVEEQQTDAADTFTPPDSARANAQRVLDWRERYGDEVKGMTAVGWTRARQLASGEPISLDIVKRIAQFNRHRQNSKVAPEYKDTPWKDAGHVAWLGWGGTTGIDWAIRVSAKADTWDHADADDILEYLVGWRADAPKGGKGGKKKRTEKPKCTKGRSCGMSCIAMSKRCPPDKLGPAADVVAKSVASSGGGKGKTPKPKSTPKAKALNLTPLGDAVKDTYLSKVTGMNNIGDMFKPGADSIASDAPPDPALVAAFKGGQKNGTLAMMTFDDNRNAFVPIDSTSAIIMASAKAAGTQLNGLIVRDNDGSLAQSLHKVNGAVTMVKEGDGKGMSDVGLMRRVTASEIKPGRVNATQADIDEAARSIREEGGRSMLPIPVREAKDGSGYIAVGNGNLLAVAQRANVDPWIYIVGETPDSKDDAADTWDDHADADDILEYLVGWRADAPKGGKKKRTTKPKCTKGRSCGMSCIAMSKRCPPDKLGEAADVLAKSVANSSGGTGGGKGQASQSVKPKATQEKVPDTIADRNKPLYKAAIDGKQIRVTADQKNAAASVTGNAGPWQNSKVDRIRKEKAKVTKDEAAALAAYIGAKYAPMSAAIYAPGDPSFDAPGSVDAANRLAANAMRKLDPITEDSINARAREYAARNGDVDDAPLYDAGRGLQRGITLNGQAFKDKITQYQTALAGDGLVREDTWFATSTLSVENDDVSIAAQSNVIYRIKPNLNGTGQGRYVDHFKNRTIEGEVLYPPYSQFRVTGVQTSKDKNAVIAEMGLTRDQQIMMGDAYNASYYQQTFGAGWKKVYEAQMGEKPPSASSIKKGLALRQQVESQVTGSGVTYIDLEEL
jgi:hypothetical protein